MKKTTLAIVILCLAISGTILLSGCQGILSELYDEPIENDVKIDSGLLRVDASDWGEWHYIDLKNPMLRWRTYDIPYPDSTALASIPQSEAPGIYTYWYDVFGIGTSNYEFCGFVPTDKQPEPEDWTFAVHRNNVRTNGCGVCETSYTSISKLPEDSAWMKQLDFTEDEWNQTDVWTVKDRMLSGIIGNQGIHLNTELGKWLQMKIPPMPPVFSLNNHVFILRLKDSTYAALQLADYMSVSGTKCVLTINYRYPL